MILSVEQSVPHTLVNPQSFTTLGGHVDYTAIMTPKQDASKLP